MSEDLKMNSKEYWDHRFDTDWLEFGGDQQSSFFANLLCELMPKDVVEEIEKNQYSVCDMGCALGDSIPVLQYALGVPVDGMDFSAEAIAQAKRKYMANNLFVGDLTDLKLEKRYDVTISSNVMEHFAEPWKILKNLSEVTDRYIIVMVPYRETLEIDEHEYHFNESNIPLQMGEFSLHYVKTADGRDYENTSYPDQQILLVYKKEPKKSGELSDLSGGTEASWQRDRKKIIADLTAELTVVKEELEAKEQQRQLFEDESVKLSRELTQVREEMVEKVEIQQNQLVEQQEQLAQQQELLAQKAGELAQKDGEIAQMQTELETMGAKLSEMELNCRAVEESLGITRENLQAAEENLKVAEELRTAAEQKLQELAEMTRLYELEQQENLELKGRLEQSAAQAAQMQNALNEVSALCYQINGKTNYKVYCTLARFGKQFVTGSWSDKKNFLDICGRAIRRERSEFTGNDGYNMILNVANLTQLPNGGTVPMVAAAPAAPQLEVKAAAPTAPAAEPEQTVSLKKEHTVQALPAIPAATAAMLEETYDKPDIVIFSVIDYSFRFQRPQHFASRFAQNGHRVFYVDANFTNKEQVQEISEKLHIVDWSSKNCRAIYFTDEDAGFNEWFKEKADRLVKEYAIRDAILILDYPNWIHGAEYMSKTYGFSMVVDYMDDFTGFLGTTTSTLKDNCEYMLQKSDLVVASSDFLCNIAAKYTDNIHAVRNGTEYEHFHQAISLAKPHKRPVIGYYGAVAHWFAWEKVCYLAEKLPECDIVIIGDITEHREKLEKYKNIQLLGEKKYQELPKYLADFDVCLIPFDTSTDLIKATNPVKFYEYLSAGKKIVATEIPELMPYQDQYVYMSNDDETFLSYVKMCLDGTDKLADAEDAIRFAQENDWQSRYEQFAKACVAAVPKVSVVVLTYNNLKLNKYCIESILKKTAYANYELIIVDNQSTDGTIEYLRELEAENHPQVKIIFNDKNSGFAGGNNLAIEKSEGDVVVLLNNDTVVTRGWLTAGVKHLKNDAKCGMVGAVTNSIGNESMIGVQYHNLKELEQFAYAYTQAHNNEIFTDIDRLAMFAVYIRRSIINEHGMLDDSYQVGMFEDDDYAMLVKTAGYELYAAEDVFIHHVNNASFKKLQSEEYKRIFEKNKKLFEDKWQVKWQMPKYRPGVTADINKGMMVEPIE
ncbi:MAG: glycosyltransferase [Eubacteriales bacterium]|nr:glycosyltransferase [Eubacteriales bacterium]